MDTVLELYDLKKLAADFKQHLDIQGGQDSEFSKLLRDGRSAAEELIDSRQQIQTLTQQKNNLQQEKESLQKEVGELESLLQGQPPSLWMSREVRYKRDLREYELRIRYMESQISKLHKRIRDLQSQDYIQNIEEKVQFLQAQNQSIYKDNHKLQHKLSYVAKNINWIKTDETPILAKIKDEVDKIEKSKGSNPNLHLKLHNLASTNESSSTDSYSSRRSETGESRSSVQQINEVQTTNMDFINSMEQPQQVNNRTLQKNRFSSIREQIQNQSEISIKNSELESERSYPRKFKSRSFAENLNFFSSIKSNQSCQSLDFENSFQNDEEGDLQSSGKQHHFMNQKLHDSFNSGITQEIGRVKFEDNSDSSYSLSQMESHEFMNDLPSARGFERMMSQGEIQDGEEVDIEFVRFLQSRNREYEQKFKLQEERFQRMQNTAMEIDVQRMAAESALEVALNQIHHLQDKRLISPRNRSKQAEAVKQKFKFSQQQHQKLHQRIDSMHIDIDIAANNAADAAASFNNFDMEKQMLTEDLARVKILLADALDEIDEFKKQEQGQVLKKGGEGSFIRRALRRR